MTLISSAQLPLVIIGAGGHAKVLHSLLIATGRTIMGVCDPYLAQEEIGFWRGVPVLGGDDVLQNRDPQSIGLVNGLGQTAKSNKRSEIFDRYKSGGFTFPFLVHPNSWIAPTAHLSEGVQVMAGAVIQPDCVIGENTIINTGACLDHDCKIGRNVHIAPGATLSGEVTIGDYCLLGTGCSIINGIEIGDCCVVGAGAVVVGNHSSNSTVIGVPARSRIAE